MEEKKNLEIAYFRGVPNARRINPLYRSIFEFFYKAHETMKPGDRVLNIYASHDFSARREEVYRERFFKGAEYHGVDFWHDKFIPEGKSEEDVAQNKRHTMPYPDNYFDIIATTKVILEHVSEPEAVMRELYRIVKPGGHAFIVAPHVRRQHQHPYDYYRYTEFGLQYLFDKVGFRVLSIDHTNGFMATAGSYFYFFQRGLGLPKWLEKIFDFFHKWVIEPVFYFLDRFDNGYGRDMTHYFLVRAQK